MTIKDTIGGLRAEVEALGPSRPGRHFPPALRARLRAAARRLARSHKHREVADALGIAPETVRRWCLGSAEAEEPVALVPVEVDRVVAKGLRLVSPRGFVLEGLDVETAAELLARVG